MKRLLTVLPMLILFVGCTQSPPPVDASVIRARSAAWEAAFNAKDIDAVVDLYESDARLLPPNAGMESGSGALRAAFGAMIDAGLSAELTSVETVVSGDIAYNIGTYTLMAGDIQADVGKYLEIWHRGDDGQWRYSNDMYSSNIPVATPPEAQLMIVHEVDDADRWMAAWRGDDSRHKLFLANGATQVRTFRSADNPHLTGLAITVSDMEALKAMLTSDEGVAAATEDGVRVDTIKMLNLAK